MMVKYEDVIPSLIPNTIMQKCYRDNANFVYYITPCLGYMLHDKLMDFEKVDEDTMMPTGEVERGYRESTASCEAYYDFFENPREFYTIPSASFAQK